MTTAIMGEELHAVPVDGPEFPDDDLESPGGDLQATTAPMTQIKELDVVALLHAIPGDSSAPPDDAFSPPPQGFEAGARGTVVCVLKPGKAFMVEFVTSEGETAAFLDLEMDQVRKVWDCDSKTWLTVDQIGGVESDDSSVPSLDEDQAREAGDGDNCTPRSPAA